MAAFPYTPNTKRLREFLNTIRAVSVPSQVTIKYIESLGYATKNDRYTRGILKDLGFTDSDDVPTERWKTYRDQQEGPRVLAIGIREAYMDLFKVYPDANKRDRDALTNFFTTNTSVAKTTVACIVRTFDALCELADFSSIPSEIPTSQVIESPTAQPLAEAVAEPEVPSTAQVAQEVTINVNIQLTLPETRDGSVYDRIFESLKKHLLS